MLFRRDVFDDSMFDDLFSISNNLNKLLNSFDAAGIGSSTFPPVNVYEDEKNYFVSAELPGVDIKDIKVDVKKSTLTIEGVRKNEFEGKKNSYHLTERSFGKFSRSITIDKNIIPDKVNAKMKNGVLLITIPKAEEEMPKQISIKVEE